MTGAGGARRGVPWRDRVAPATRRYSFPGTGRLPAPAPGPGFLATWSNEMRAVGLNEYGGPDVLHLVELPDPEPAPGEVRVRVQAAGINPADVMLRQGDLADLYAGVDPPFVPGMDIAGVIDAVGDGVEAGSVPAVGEKVVGIVDNHGRYGGYSEYVCLPAASVTPVPAGTDIPAAAAFLMNALTARNALDTLDLAPGSTLLVTGAAGAVGTYTTALANDDGLRIVAIASPQDEAYLRDRGATDFVPRGEDAAERVREAFPDGVDAVVDAASLGGRIAPAVRDGGMFIILRPAEQTSFGRGMTVTFVNVRERATDHEAIARIARQVESGLLPPRVAGTFPAAEASEAHRRLDAGGARGRFVLEFD